MSVVLNKILTLILLFIVSNLLWRIFAQLHSFDFPQNRLPKTNANSRIPLLDHYHGDLRKTEKSCYGNKRKMMFTKNLKVAGSTISSILIQIATHYHKHEIVAANNLEQFLKENKTKHGYLVTHQYLKSLTLYKTIFPKKDFLWISTTRNVADQVISHIKFARSEEFYSPNKFDETLRQFVSNGKHDLNSIKTRPFWNGGTRQILFQCRKERDFKKFKQCAQEIFKEFDLIIPVDRLNEGLIMLQKMTCLPLSDFAYTKKKLSSGNFSMTPENMSALLAYHGQSIWFYNYASAEFNKKFSQFQSKFCKSFNCQNEVAELNLENKKLEESCGLHRVNGEKFYNIDYDWENLKKNDSLAVRCMSFALNGNSFNEFRVYNKHLQNNEDGTAIKKIASDWTRLLRHKHFF